MNLVMTLAVALRHWNFWRWSTSYSAVSSLLLIGLHKIFVSIPRQSQPDADPPRGGQPEEDGLHQEKTRYVLRDIAALEINGKGTGRKGTGHNGKEQAVQIGVAKCEWSHFSRFLAVVSDANGQVVWIWDLKDLVFHSIFVHKESVLAMEWNTVNHRLQFNT